MGASVTASSGYEVLVFAIGSGGDVHPSIGIGRALRARGHRVVFAANSHFEGAVRRAGLDFLSTGTEEEYLRTTQDPDLWRLGKGFRVLFRVMLDGMRRQYEIIAERYQRGPTLVIAPSSALGARIANEKLGAPLVNMHLQPLGLRSLNEQPGLALPAAFEPLLPPVRKVFLAALDRWVLDPPLLPELNRFRVELGLAPVQRVLNTWIHSPQRIIGLWPEWFAPSRLGWPQQVRLTGFPLFDETGTRELSPSVAEFLDGGEPPIVFTLGTAMRFGARFFAVSAEACRKLGRRGVLLTQFREQIPSTLPDGIRHFEYIPFSFLLPRCAALVHHGGIGTIAQALSAAVPQLITPMNFDQPSNAGRVRALGVGESLRPAAYTAENARAKLDRLLSHAPIRRTCQEIARHFESGDPVRQTCELIEAEMEPQKDRRVASGR
jgi:UDP:flavonoid glycosyltransferase YjiC (YdhE family)